jgi:hypothetical protein
MLSKTGRRGQNKEYPVNTLQLAVPFFHDGLHCYFYAKISPCAYVLYVLHMYILGNYIKFSSKQL